MSIIEPTDKVRKWKYNIDLMNLIIPGEEPYTIPNERMNNLIISHKYEGYICPIFKLTIVLESSVYYRIIKNKSTVKFHLVISKYFKEQGSQTASMNQGFINDTFDLITDNDENDMLKNMRLESSSSDFSVISKKVDNDMNMVDNRIDLFFYKADIINSLKTNVNEILPKATTAGAFGYLLGKAKLQKLLMSQPENPTVYDPLVIPPLSIIEAMSFVDSYYGLYKKGSIIYFDLDRNYILNYNGLCTAYEPNELKDVCIVIPEVTTEHPQDTGALYKKGVTATTYIIGEYQSMDIRNESITNAAVASYSTDATIIDNDTGSVTATTSTAIKNVDTSSKIMENTTENPYVAETYSAQTSANSVVIQLLVSDYDCSYIKPNKKYSFLFEDTKLSIKYKGLYKLSSVEHTFMNDGSVMTLSSIMCFKKLT